jgi:hypothetical protein
LRFNVEITNYYAKLLVNGNIMPIGIVIKPVSPENGFYNCEIAAKLQKT